MALGYERLVYLKYSYGRDGSDGVVDLGTGILRVAKVNKTYAEVSGGINTNQISVEAQFTQNNQYVDFVNHALTSIRPWRFGNPTQCSNYDVIWQFSQYASFIDFSPSNPNWTYDRFQILDQNGHGFSSAGAGITGASTLAFDGVNPTGAGYGFMGTVAINTTSAATTGLTVTSDGRVFYYQIIAGTNGRYVCNVRYFDVGTSAAIVAWLEGLAPYPKDPYSPGGPSGPGAGDGTFDFSSTDIPVPGLPSISAADTGFVSLYKATSVELKTLANYLWSTAFDLDNLKKMFVNPMDVILGCHIVPTTPNGPAGVASTLVVGNISSGISMTRLSAQ